MNYNLIPNLQQNVLSTVYIIQALCISVVTILKFPNSIRYLENVDIRYHFQYFNNHF